MDFPAIMDFANNFGAWGVFVGYLIWDRVRREARDKEVEDARMALAEKRLEADKSLATSLALLDATIKGTR